MAKLKGPLFSLNASGAIAKTLVYFSWKGLKVVRQWVIPTNPQSDDQTTQRNILTAAVALWHNVKYVAADKVAWRSYASIAAKPLTGFNAFVKSFIEIVLSGIAAPNPGFNAGIVSGGAGFIDIYVDEDGTASSCFATWGYSKTALVNQAVMGEGPADTWTSGNIAATAGRRVYARIFTNDGADVLGWTGIFHFDVV